jgi:NitT/TauT family transport system substrate-binding protein
MIRFGLVAVRRLSLVAASAICLAWAPSAFAQAGAKPLVDMKITVSTHPLLDFSAPIFVAMKQGFFEKEGVRITEVVSSEGGGTTVRNILTGGLDMGLVSFPAALQVNLSGTPLKIVEGGERIITSHMLVAAENSKITSLKDAVAQGATIGYSSPGSVTQAVLVLSLQRMGIDPTKVSSRPTGGLGAGFTLVRGGGLAVTSAIEPVFAISGKGLKVIERLSDHIKKFQQMVWVVNPQFMSAHPEAVAGFLRAHLAAVNWIAANVDEAAAIWAKEADIPKEAALAAFASDVRAGGIKAYYGTGYDREAMEAAVDSMRYFGTIKADAVIPWKDILDQSKLPPEAVKVDVSTFPNPKGG